MSNKEAFDRIAGDCAGIDVHTITPDDVRWMAEAHALCGDECSPEEIEAAVLGLREYQENQA